MALPRYYNKEDLQNIREQRERIQGKSNSLMTQFVSYRFANEQAGEYARHGLHGAYKSWPGAPKTCLRAFQRAP